VGSESVNAAPVQRARLALALGLLLMIVGLLCLQQGILHRWSSGTVQDRGSQILQAVGLLLLAGSTLMILAGAIYGSLKLILPVAAAAGIVSLAIAAIFSYWWFISLEEGITLRNWTLALSIPGFVWTAAGGIFLLVACLRFILGKIDGRNERA
jgi:hypothetical protein